jgi:hypothetical protein
MRRIIPCREGFNDADQRLSRGAIAFAANSDVPAEPR